MDHIILMNICPKLYTSDAIPLEYLHFHQVITTYLNQRKYGRHVRYHCLIGQYRIRTIDISRHFL